VPLSTVTNVFMHDGFKAIEEAKVKTENETVCPIRCKMKNCQELCPRLS